MSTQDWAAPMGYCGRNMFNQPYDPKQHSFLFFEEEHYNREKAKEEPFFAKYHNDGHATAEEACLCYTEYQLDHSLKFWNSEKEQRRCKVCGDWTTGRGSIDYLREYDLCLKHQTREEVAKFYTAGEVWSF